MIIIILVISVVINLFLLVYVRWILKKLVFFSENIEDLLSSVGSFSKHLEGIYELETFYGDLTLKNLITHSRELIKDIEIYEDIYTLFDTEDEEVLERVFEEEGDYAKEEAEE